MAVSLDGSMPPRRRSGTTCPTMAPKRGARPARERSSARSQPWERQRPQGSRLDYGRLRPVSRYARSRCGRKSSLLYAVAVHRVLCLGVDGACARERVSGSRVLQTPAPRRRTPISSVLGAALRIVAFARAGRGVGALLALGGAAQRDVELLQLLLGDGTGGVHHLVARGLGLREGHDLADVRLVP